MDNIGSGQGFTNIDSLPLGKILQTSYSRKKPEMPKIQNKKLVSSLMDKMPTRSTGFNNMTGSK